MRSGESVAAFLVFLLYFVTGCSFCFQICVRRFRLRNQLLEPIALFGLLFPFSYYFVPVLAGLLDLYRYQETYSLKTQLLAWIQFSIFGVVTLVTYIVARGPIVYHESLTHLSDARRWVTYGRHTMIVLGLVLLVPMLWSVHWLMQLISTHGLSRFFSNRIILTSGAGYQMMPLRFGLLYSMVYFCNSLMQWVKGHRRLKWKSIVIVVVCCAILPASLTGGRASLLIPIVFLVIVYLLVVHRGILSAHRVVALLLAATMVLTLGIALGPVRDIIKRQGELADLALEPMDFIIGVVKTYGEFENLFWLIENPDRFELLYGKTFASVLVGFVPRAWWRDKPLGGGPHLRNFIIPGSYDLQEGSNLTSYTTGLIAEAYMNFGFAGIIAVAIAYGMWLVFLARALRFATNPLLVSAWVILLWRSIEVLNAEVFGVASHVFSTVGPLILLWFFVSVVTSSSRLRHGSVGVASSAYRTAARARM